MRLFPTLSLLTASALLAQAALHRGKDFPDSCNPAATRLAPDTNSLLTDCGVLASCDSTTSTCRAHGCRNDEYPFGYSRIPRDDWPPRCAEGEFCPDEKTQCMPLQPPGSPCQLNRDDECAPPPTLAEGTHSVCLRYTCQYANASSADRCINDNTVYTTYVSQSHKYGTIISHDNCRTGLYCDAPSLVCKPAQPVGASCSADKECLTHVCSDPSFKSTQPITNEARGVCAERPRFSAPARPGLIAAILALVALSALLFCIALGRLHAKQRRARHAELRAYEAEQRTLRADVWATYGAARQAVASVCSSGAATPVKATHGSGGLGGGLAGGGASRRVSAISANSTSSEAPEMALLAYHSSSMPASPVTSGRPEKRTSRLNVVSNAYGQVEGERDPYTAMGGDEGRVKMGQPF